MELWAIPACAIGIFLLAKMFKKEDFSFNGAQSNDRDSSVDLPKPEEHPEEGKMSERYPNTYLPDPVCAERAIEITQKIWGYVIHSFDTEDIPYGDIAFTFGIYCYSVSGILRCYHMDAMVRDLFTSSFSFMFKKDQSDPFVGMLQGLVNGTIEWMRDGNFDCSTQEGARRILSQKSRVLGAGDAESYFCGIDISDAESACFVRDVRHLRDDTILILDKPIVTKQQTIQEPPAKSASVPNIPQFIPRKRYRKEYETPASTMILLGAVIFFAVIVGWLSMPQTAEKSSTPSSIASTQPITYKPVTPPPTGTVLRRPSEECVAPLRIHTSGSGYYYYVLSKAGTGTRYMTFFGKAGETVDVDVPIGTFDLFYAYGETWYGAAYLFGESTHYERCDQSLSFKYSPEGYSGYELTLYAVQNGNMDTKEVKQSDFPTW